MHSAFLQQPDGQWKLTSSPDAVLSHDGDLLINENVDEKDANLELLGFREGKEAVLWGDAVLLTETRLWHNENEALAELQTTGEALVRHVSNFEAVTLRDGTVQTFGSQWMTEERLAEGRAKWNGVVAVKEGQFFRLRKDEVLWAAAEVAKVRKARREARAESKKLPNRWAFESVADNCAKALGCNPTTSFRIEQLWTWLAAHDAALGKRATNKLALECAKRWCNDRAKSKKWLNRWASADVVKRTDERLAAVCRLGDRNSRHKA